MMEPIRKIFWSFLAMQLCWNTCTPSHCYMCLLLPHQDRDSGYHFGKESLQAFIYYQPSSSTFSMDFFLLKSAVQQDTFFFSHVPCFCHPKKPKASFTSKTAIFLICINVESRVDANKKGQEPEFSRNHLIWGWGTNNIKHFPLNDWINSNMGVSKNRGTPKSSILIGFSIIFTIHFGVPLFLETPIWTFETCESLVKLSESLFSLWSFHKS